MRVLITAVVLLMVAGCRQVRTIERNDVATAATIERNDVKIIADTVIIRDSVNVLTASDTVYITRYKTAYRMRLRVDTVRTAVTDTVRVKEVVTKEVAHGRGLPWWLDLLTLAAAVLVLYKLLK